MPYSEPLADRVRDCLARRRGVTEKKMFGGLAFVLRGNMCCGILEDRLMLRLGEERTAAALEEPHTHPMDFAGRVIKTMLFVQPEGIDSDADLQRWVDRAVDFAQTLPRKAV